MKLLEVPSTPHSLPAAVRALTVLPRPEPGAVPLPTVALSLGKVSSAPP